MTVTALQDRSDAKARVLNGLARLRAEFPLEQRVLDAAPTARTAYAQLLRHWMRGLPPSSATIDSSMLEQLARLDAVVPEESGLGCYPFSSADTGIRVTLPTGTVNAMCAIDALAIARLVRASAQIDSTCVTCGSAITCRIGEDGGLDHDQVEVARVVWQQVGDAQASCSRGLCRQIRFLCRACPDPQASECFTLPQAAAIGNAFFRFQSALLAAQADPAA
jgi:hypothetical protein